MPGKLLSVTIERVSNGFVVRQSKREKSSKRNWTSLTTVHTESNEVIRKLSVILDHWPADNEG